jgi:hypothetical protein
MYFAQGMGSEKYYALSLDADSSLATPACQDAGGVNSQLPYTHQRPNDPAVADIHFLQIPDWTYGWDPQSQEEIWMDNGRTEPKNWKPSAPSNSTPSFWFQLVRKSLTTYSSENGRLTSTGCQLG